MRKSKKKTKPSVHSGGADGSVVQDLFKIARTLSSTLDVDVLLREIGNAAEQLTHSQASSILLLSDDGKYLYFKIATGEKGTILKKCMIPLDQGIAGWVAHHWKSQIVNDVSKDDRFLSRMDSDTGFKTCSVLAVPVIMGDHLIGVCEAINKKDNKFFTDEDLKILEDLANFAAVAIVNARLAEKQHNFFTNMIDILIASIEASHPHYIGHPAKVAESACAIAKSLGMEGQAYRDLYYGALLHDIGMMAVNHKILSEQTTQLAKERSVDRLHPVLGADILKNVKMLQGSVPIIKHHHEHWDGTGHPDRLSKDQIPLGARIICLIEYLEEIRFTGIQDPELTDMQKQMAQNGSGSKFDPKVVQAYLDRVNKSS